MLGGAVIGAAFTALGGQISKLTLIAMVTLVLTPLVALMVALIGIFVFVLLCMAAQTLIAPNEPRRWELTAAFVAGFLLLFVTVSYGTLESGVGPW